MEVAEAVETLVKDRLEEAVRAAAVLAVAASAAAGMALAPRAGAGLAGAV